MFWPLMSPWATGCGHAEVPAPYVVCGEKTRVTEPTNLTPLPIPTPMVSTRCGRSISLSSSGDRLMNSTSAQSVPASRPHAETAHPIFSDVHASANMLLVRLFAGKSGRNGSFRFGIQFPFLNYVPNLCLFLTSHPVDRIHQPHPSATLPTSLLQHTAPPRETKGNRNRENVILHFLARKFVIRRFRRERIGGNGIWGNARLAVTRTKGSR